MIRPYGLFLLIVPVAAAIPATSAQAQSYPPSYYRSAPPDIYGKRLPPPVYWADDDDDVPVTQRPPRDPRYSPMPPQSQRDPVAAPSRIVPYPDEADAAPPPPAFAIQNGQPPAYGHQLDEQTPPSPAPSAGRSDDLGVIRPPAPIGATPNSAPQPPAAQAGSTVMTLPPEDQPEVGQPKELPANLKKQLVDYSTREPAGTIVVDTPNTYLYLVLGGGKALRYGIGVGREGFTWTGGERISRMKEWPDWFPPAEMIGRQPYLPRVMAGGPGNPLGARALYLGSTLYRIHGTNQPSTIGQFVSSGCIRLLNEDIEDLYSRVQVGTRVVVLPGKPPETVASAPAPIVAGSASGVTQIAPSNNNPPAITSSQLPPVR